MNSAVQWLPCSSAPEQRFVCEGSESATRKRPGTQLELSAEPFMCRWEADPNLCLDMWNDQGKMLLYKCVGTANQFFYVDSYGRWRSYKDGQCITADGLGDNLVTRCDAFVKLVPPAQRLELTDLVLPPFPPGLAPSPDPPAAPPPPPEKERPMDSDTCHRMIRDETHIFRRMWAATAWGKMSMDDGDQQPACWNVDRVLKDHTHTQWQATDTYWEETASGRWCDTNWYETDNGDDIGKPDVKFPPLLDKNRVAPAAFGFDESIDQHCAAELGKMGQRADPNAWAHARNCQRANVNILALYGTRLPYNICRNLEWMSCAAQGKLAGQMNQPEVVFAKAPGQLYPGGRWNKPVGECCGWAPDQVPQTGFGYTTDDIFYLEVCLLNEMCENGAEIFNVQAGGHFRCVFSPDRFSRLGKIFTAGFKEPQHATQCRHHKKCDERNTDNDKDKQDAKKG